MLFVLTLLTWSSAIFAAGQNLSSSDNVTPVEKHVCGEIISWANEDLDSNFLFYASQVHECLQSVPLIPAVALRYLDYFNTTIQFQSTLAYLKNPPAGYQQPAIDVPAALEAIKHNITAGYYLNQYAFEVTLQSLVQRMHDSHASLSAGIIRPFWFGSPHEIVSLSVDGKKAPQVFLKSDVENGPSQGWNPSAVASINGEEVTSYLKRFASLNSPGAIEAHAEWNQLMWNPIQDVLGTGNVFGWTTTFYPGDKLEFILENNTVISDNWLAIYNNQEETGPLATGGDFYNYFVLGLLPAPLRALYDTPEFPGANDTGSDNSSTDNSSSNTSEPSSLGPTSWSSVTSAFPSNPDIIQKDLGGSGYTTGYFLRDISTAVLSMPTFADDSEEGTIQAFSNATADFVRAARANGMQKVIIDLQQNQGGAALLAFDTFKQFFPNIDPYAGSRRRDSELANILGSTITKYWSSLPPDSNDDNDSFDYYYYASNEWVVTNRINANEARLFASWPEFYGPVPALGDQFSLTERYNLSDDVFIASALDGSDLAALGNASFPPSNPPWSPENIVLLTDAACSSTCALFVEMMKHDAGVRTVVVGGTPDPGPMQAVGGTRGASLYDADQLDDDMNLARSKDDTAAANLPLREQAILTYFMSFNLRDQIRRNQTVPLQFQYEAADCRIYYTIDNAFNLTRLWHDVAAAAFVDSSLCVPGSIGNATSTPEPPKFEVGPGSFQSIAGANKPDLEFDFEQDHGPGIVDGGRPGPFAPPGPGDRCDVNYVAQRKVCKDQSKIVVVCGSSCRPKLGDADCGSQGTCGGAPIDGGRQAKVYGDPKGTPRNKDIGRGNCKYTGTPGREYGC